MDAKQPIHLRLPQRADTVEGREQPGGQPSKASSAKDPRTITQDPALKPKGLTP
jgi:hypothetical protein